MNRFICILLMGWLPIFMVTASAMSLQMTLQSQNHHAQTVDVSPCHDKVSTQQDKVHQCIACGFCMMATAMASFDTVPVLDIPAFISTAPLSFDVSFNSTNPSPGFRPRILN